MNELRTKASGVLRGLEVTAICFSVVTGACSLGILVWKGGAISQMVSTHEMRLTRIETGGSPTLDSHVKLDEERDKAIRGRLEKLEDIYRIALDMRTDLGRISQKVDDLRDQMQKRP